MKDHYVQNSRLSYKWLRYIMAALDFILNNQDMLLQVEVSLGTDDDRMLLPVVNFLLIKRQKFF